MQCPVGLGSCHLKEVAELAQASSSGLFPVHGVICFGSAHVEMSLVWEQTGLGSVGAKTEAIPFRYLVSSHWCLLPHLC